MYFSETNNCFLASRNVTQNRSSLDSKTKEENSNTVKHGQTDRAPALTDSITLERFIQNKMNYDVVFFTSFSLAESSPCDLQITLPQILLMPN